MATSSRKPEPGELSDVCTTHNPDPVVQRRMILDLLRAGADIGEADKNGVTRLHHAVRFRSAVAVQTLIEHGADVNRACKRSGSTPLHRAVTSTGAPETAGKSDAARTIVKLLLAAGANPAIANRIGKTPLDYTKDVAIRAMLSAASLNSGTTSPHSPAASRTPGS